MAEKLRDKGLPDISPETMHKVKWVLSLIAGSVTPKDRFLVYVNALMAELYEGKKISAATKFKIGLIENDLIKKTSMMTIESHIQAIIRDVRLTHPKPPTH